MALTATRLMTRPMHRFLSSSLDISHSRLREEDDAKGEAQGDCRDERHQVALLVAHQYASIAL